MTDEDTQEILEAVATQLTVARDECQPHGIIVGHLPNDQAPHIDHIDYQEGSQQIWLRLTNGEAWLLRVHRLGSRVYGETDAGHIDTISSYQQYKHLNQQWHLIRRTVKSAYDTDLDGDQLLQAFYDETLTDTERRHWDRWNPGGYATAQEWAAVSHLIN